VTDEEKLAAACLNARQNGRKVIVLTAMDHSAREVSFVGIGLVEEIESNPSAAHIISLPKRDADLLLLDLSNALSGKSQPIEILADTLLKKGPRA
jgi:hypothetical protein